MGGEVEVEVSEWRGGVDEEEGDVKLEGGGRREEGRWREEGGG